MIEDKGEMFEKKLQAIADELEKVRLQIYVQVSNEEEKKHPIDNELFSLQSRIREIGHEEVAYFDYKD